MKVSLSTIAVLTGALLASPTTAKSGPTAVAYIEVNNNDISNVGRYTLSDGSPAFDIGIIFAANINYNGSAAVLFNGDPVQSTLNNAATSIVPLQQKGIKVLLSILGNHQGAGISNFASQAAAADFASQVAEVVSQYNLDGVDLDDEYADYGTNGTPGTNDQSVGWLISELKSQMPGKLVTFYNFGPASDTLASADPSVGGQLDFAWNAIYGTYEAPTIAGLGNDKLAPAAIDYESTPSSDAANFAQNTISQGYGAYMTYDLEGGDNSAYVSSFTQVLYGEAATYN